MQTIHLSLHTAPPWGGTTLLLHRSTRKTSKCHYEWMKNADVPIKWQWQKGSHFRYHWYFWQREVTTLEPSASCIPGFLGRKQGRVAKWRTSVYSPCQTDATPLEEQCISARCVEEQNTHQSAQKAVFFSPHSWGALPHHCCSISFTSLPDPKFCVVQRRGRKWCSVAWQRQAPGQWRDEPCG